MLEQDRTDLPLFQNFLRDTTIKLFISFVARDAKFDDIQRWVWQDEVFRDIDETSSVQVNHWIDHVTHGFN